MASFFKRFANPRENSPPTTALRCSMIPTSFDGMEKSCESFSHFNSGIHLNMMSISMDVLATNLERIKKKLTQRAKNAGKRTAEAEKMLFSFSRFSLVLLFVKSGLRVDCSGAIYS